MRLTMTNSESPPLASTPQIPAWRIALAEKGIALIRIGFGLVFLTNGLAKVIGWDGIHPFPGYLITMDGARGILEFDTQSHPVGLYKDFIDDVVLANWSVFSVLLTLGELFIGVTLVSGAFANLGAITGILFALHLNFANWDRNIWAWEYAVEWIPLMGLLLIGAGRYFGLDAWSARFLPSPLRRWPLTG
jgi:uncharacterized membrane protein YphA (DoxX/SURF4 family)